MKKELSVSAIKDGTVIDHIPSSETLKVVDILDLKGVRSVISVATNLPSKKMGKKGIIKIGGKNLTKEEVDKIALIAPDATVNIIKDYEVKKKIEVAVPQTINRIIKCSNPNCVTNNEKATTRFCVLNKSPIKLRCHYCERNMDKEDISLL
ncbi:aspartate carbamoyltransferase regulatory subunit [Candidatus Woesearchaeota archaeon]|nr:aspartate carbamoyltransferase regulatory subunit [Candidatus Woesearchaeota archaeon]